MRYFPAFFDLRDRPVFLIGGGELAVRKARLVTQAHPRLIVFSASPDADIRATFPGATIFERAVAVADFEADKPALLIAAADDLTVDGAAAAMARAHGVPANVVDQPQLCDVVVPSIVARGDVAIGISTGGAAPVLGRRLRERIEALLPARLGQLVDFAKARRGQVADSLPQFARRGFWERLFAGPVAEAVYDGDMAAATAGFDAALTSGEAPAVGTIHIVGAGPGDPELLTLKALRVLQEADIVLYDNLVSDGVMELVRRDAERRYVGKKKGDHSLPQEEIGELMVRLAREGRRVVRLKGGDPYIFGRGGEEVDAVQAAGLHATVIPGITAASGCATAGGVPLTHRGLSQAVTYVTAYGGGGGAPEVDWSALARLGQTVVVYMGVGRAGQVAADLMAGGMTPSMPAAIVEHGTLPSQRIIRTHLCGLGASIAAHGVTGPAVLIIGEVAVRAEETLAAHALAEVA